ncbi:right-handed parallel beta-helix repeat-containing protein [Brevibacillus parabrevis]|uniref:right-handed parallel beta-helix repeat-containing protein n=1 Tax=Brevibacillus parabrevis TaxID=54914 RepID=UPI001F60AC3B|nr:right-handed parallel beta-helix repeat-containing protein [Brevibacillus parabrevis]MDR5000266.1 NosD domain-containing protein [Brevibacillus parabrevis]
MALRQLLSASLAIALVMPAALTALAEESADSLQAQIDRAAPGETITIPEGKYEGPIRITKPLKLVADGDVKLTNPSEEAALIIAADDVTLQGITVVDRRINSEDASIIVKGNRNLLEKVTVDTMGTGVQLRGANSNTLHKVFVIGKVKDRGSTSDAGHDHSAHLSKSQSKPKVTVQAQKGNGIDLYDSNDNRLTDNQVTNVFDGIYLEKSSGNQLEQNWVEKSRYGYHLMGTTNTTLKNNTGSENVTGAMLMETSEATVIGNQFLKQQKNPNSQGILLYDVQNSLITDNRIEGNRVGLYLERSTGITVKGNQLALNFVGMQLTSSSQNTWTNNQFISNVIAAQAQDSATDNINGNYWDNLLGLDVDGDHISDLPYEMNPFYLGLTDAVPAYQLFFQSPGFVFLENLFTNGAGSPIRDNSPLMPTSAVLAADAQTTSGWGAGILGLILLLGSCTFIYVGVKKS